MALEIENLEKKCRKAIMYWFYTYSVQLYDYLRLLWDSFLYLSTSKHIVFYTHFLVKYTRLYQPHVQITMCPHTTYKYLTENTATSWVVEYLEYLSLILYYAWRGRDLNPEPLTCALPSELLPHVLPEQTKLITTS